VNAHRPRKKFEVIYQRHHTISAHVGKVASSIEVTRLTVGSGTYGKCSALLLRCMLRFRSEEIELYLLGLLDTCRETMGLFPTRPQSQTWEGSSAMTVAFFSSDLLPMLDHVTHILTWPTQRCG
jgi:hypothetical protein